MRKTPAVTLACLAFVSGRAAALQTAPDTSWVHRSALYEVFVRDFSPTGDFKGVARGLDRIQAVGANVIWLMPIYPVGVLGHKGPLGSSYAVRDYRAINSDYGTAADFKALVQAVHARGMKLILDWVPNHTAWDNAWIKTHPDFYARNERGEITVPRDEKGNLTDWTDVAQLDYKNPELRHAMIAAMSYWLEEFGIDGFRMDVAGFVPDTFWRQAVPALRATAGRPILFLAEWGDLKMHRLGFDLTYAWDSYSRLKAVWAGAPAATFLPRELQDMQAMPPGGMRMRFTTNHDETAWDNPPVTLFQGPAGARAAYVAMALLPGRPLLYNGQDVESPQKLGLFVQDSVVWGQSDTTAARAFYGRVLHLAETDSAFLSGDLHDVETSAPADVISYGRGNAAVLVNTRPTPVRVTVKFFQVAGARDLLSDTVQQGDTVSIPAYGAMVVERR
jgi:glycosidase